MCHFPVVHHSDDDGGVNSRETTPPCTEAQQPESIGKNIERTSIAKEYPVTVQKSSTEISPALLDTMEVPLGGVGCNVNKVSVDEHCYECKVHYRDPKSKDLIMYLHAWKYKVCNAVLSV